MPANKPTNLAAALHLADGGDLPAPMIEVRRLRAAADAARPRSDAGTAPGDPSRHIARALEAGPDGFPEALDAAAAEYARALLLAHGRRALNLGLDARAKAARAAAADEIHERLGAAFNERAEKLAKAAADLPAGRAALDPEAAVGTERSRRAYLTATTVLDELLTLAGGVEVEPVRHHEHVTRGTRVALLVDLPKVAEQRINSLNREPLNSADEVDAARVVRAVCAAFADDKRLTLVDVARGAFAGVSLSFAPSPAVLVERLANARRADTVRAVREPVPA